MSRKVLIVLGAAAFTAAPLFAQTSIGPNGIRSGNTVVDASGVHTNGVDVTSAGVRTTRGAGSVISTNGKHEAVNCDGGSLTINGNSNELNVRGCSRVVLNGNQNKVSALFEKGGSLSVVGNRNEVRWDAPSGVRVATTDVGTKNIVQHR